VPLAGGALACRFDQVLGTARR